MEHGETERVRGAAEEKRVAEAVRWKRAAMGGSIIIIVGLFWK
jgi:hypothetical protein